MTTPQAERPVISAGIIINDGKLLLVQRRVKEGRAASPGAFASLE